MLNAAVFHYEWVGTVWSFLVSPRLGIALVPEEPCWVTAPAQACLPQWAALEGWAAAAQNGNAL